MMVCLLAKMAANQGKKCRNESHATKHGHHPREDGHRPRMNVNLRKIKNEKIKSDQAQMKSTVRAIHEKMDAWKAEMKDSQKERMACQEMMAACLASEEPNPEEMQSRMEHRESPRSMLQ